MSQFGLPTWVVMDKGFIFISRMFQMYLRGNKIAHRPIVKYHPHSNWLVKHMVGTLKIMLRQAWGDKPIVHWDKPINRAVFTYNTAVHEMIGETPFFLMHGFQPCIIVFGKRETSLCMWQKVLAWMEMQEINQCRELDTQVAAKAQERSQKLKTRRQKSEGKGFKTKPPYKRQYMIEKMEGQNAYSLPLD